MKVRSFPLLRHQSREFANTFSAAQSIEDALVAPRVRSSRKMAGAEPPMFDLNYPLWAPQPLVKLSPGPGRLRHTVIDFPAQKLGTQSLYHLGHAAAAERGSCLTR